MWRGQNACSDRSPGARHTANTTEISTLPSGRFIEDHAIFASLVSGCTTALYTVEIADNGVEPRTSTTVTSGTVPMPTPHVASFLVSSYVSAQLVRGKLGCISCTGPSMWQSLFLCTPRQIQLSSSFLSTCNWTSPKSDWAAPVTLTKKGRKASKAWWHDDADE